MIQWLRCGIAARSLVSAVLLCLVGCSAPHEETDVDAPIVYDLSERVSHGTVLTGWQALKMGTQDAEAYLVSGWAARGETVDGDRVRWASRKRASVRFLSLGGETLALTVRCRPYSRFYQAQSMQVLVNGQRIGRVKLKKHHDDADYEFAIPAEAVLAGENQLEFRFAYRSRRKARSVRFNQLALSGWTTSVGGEAVLGRTTSNDWIQPGNTEAQWKVIVPRRGFLKVRPVFSTEGQIARVYLQTRDTRRLLAEFLQTPESPRDLSLAAAGGDRATLVFENAGGGEVTWISRLHGHIEPGDVNVYLISIDTLRADAVGYAGYGHDVTPALDRLAEKGTVFLSAFAQSNESAPSHASILTGRYPQSHGIIWNGRELNPQQTPLATILNDEKFRTACYVNFSILSWGTMTGHDFTTRRAILGTPKRLDMRQVRKNVFAGGLNWAKAVWEDRHFLWLHSQFLHMEDVPEPYVREAWADLAPPGATGQFDAIHADMLEQGFRFVSLEYSSGDLDLTPAQLAYWRAAYDGGIRYTDDHIAAFMNGLSSYGLDPFAAIIVVSDHGMSLGEDHRLSHVGPPHEHLLHVPLMLILPGATTPGLQVKEVVETVDIAPTLLSYLGVKVPRRMQGQNLLPLVHGDVGATGKEFAYAMVGRKNGKSYYAVRGPEWFHWSNYHGREFFGGHEADRDLESVHDGAAEARETLNHALLRWIKDTPDVSGGGNEDLSPELRKLLEKAGYLESRD